MVLALDAGIEPGTPSADAFRNQRLMDSNEPYSTFALANSLAGFLVGPLALSFAVAAREPHQARWQKSSRFVRVLARGGAGAGHAHLPDADKEPERPDRPVRGFAGIGVAGQTDRVATEGLLVLAGVRPRSAAVGGLVAAGVATKQLDIQVITESPKSLRYRLEYWQGAWGVITDAAIPNLVGWPTTLVIEKSEQGDAF